MSKTQGPVVIIGCDLVLREVIALALQNTFGLESVREVESKGQKKAGFLDSESKGPLPRCIVIDESCLGDLSKPAMKRLKAYSEKNLCVLLTNNGTKSPDGFKVIKKPDVLTPLKKLIKQELDIDPVYETSKIVYCPVQIEVFLALNSVDADTYLMLGPDKFIKVHHRGDLFGEKDFEKYHEKNISQLYIPNDQVELFLEKATANLNSLQDLYQQSSQEALGDASLFGSQLEIRKSIKDVSNALTKAENGKLDYIDGFEVCSETLDTLARTASKLGINREVQQLTKAVTTLAIKTIRNSPDLKTLLEKLEVDPNSYLSSHSTLLAGTSCSIAHMLGWTSDITFYKLTTAAFIHDITLETSELAKIRNLPELVFKATEFSESDIAKYTCHPENAAKFIAELRDVPPDIGLIVLQHHERPEGTGFPKKLNYTNLSPLSCVFIVAHDLVSYISEHQGQNWNMVTFLNRHRQEYQVGVFKTIFDAMWQRLVDSNRNAA